MFLREEMLNDTSRTSVVYPLISMNGGLFRPPITQSLRVTGSSTHVKRDLTKCDRKRDQILEEFVICFAFSKLRCQQSSSKTGAASVYLVNEPNNIADDWVIRVNLESHGSLRAIPDVRLPCTFFQSFVSISRIWRSLYLLQAEYPP